MSGLELAWRRHGRLPWRALVEPVAALADEGFWLDDELALALQQEQCVRGHLADFTRRLLPAAAGHFDGATAAAFDDFRLASTDLRRRALLLRTELVLYAESESIYLPTGVAPKAGDRLRNPKLAATLRAIADRGAAAVYSGPIAQSIVDAAQAAGGNLSLADLAGYAPIVRQPLAVDLMGSRFYGVPPPSSGGATVLQALIYLSLYSMPLSAASQVCFPHASLPGISHASPLIFP
jgi:gamma-glutamyltranspeptidase/glutathione hydrolase